MVYSIVLIPFVTAYFTVATNTAAAADQIPLYTSSASVRSALD